MSGALLLLEYHAVYATFPLPPLPKLVLFEGSRIQNDCQGRVLLMRLTIWSLTGIYLIKPVNA